MLFPISDDDRHLVKPAYVTWVLLIANVLVFCYQSQNPAFTWGYSAVPAEITSGRDIVEPTVLPGGDEEIPHMPGPWPIHLTLLTSMFMHAGIMHLGGNMLFLWIFGDNVEHRFGHGTFLLFYLASGFAASFAQIAISPASSIPTLGASGAIAGILGAYLVLFPHNRVHAIFIIRVVSVPAFLVIAIWAVTQFVSGFGSLGTTGETGGVAYAAHIGGFVAGALVALFFRRRLDTEPDSFLARTYQRDPHDRRWW